MKDTDCVLFLQWALPQLRMRWPGFRKVRRQVGKRLDRRLRQLKLPSVGAYRDYLVQHQEEWSVLDAYCRISISRFYRDRRVYDMIRHEVLPELATEVTSRGERELRIWSAGCASGEEVYTLKLVWELGVQTRFPASRLEIVGSDADPHLLQRAARGCYPSSSLHDFPPEWMAAAFRDSGEEFCVGEAFRSGIRFLHQDIRHEQPEGPFDMIGCRHLVFTYFDESLQQEVLRQVIRRLRPRGFLVIGKQEVLPITASDQLRLIQPRSGIYRWVGPAAGPLGGWPS